MIVNTTITIKVIIEWQTEEINNRTESNYNPYKHTDL